jgi:hypothetical protein
MERRVAFGMSPMEQTGAWSGAARWAEPECGAGERPAPAEAKAFRGLLVGLGLSAAVWSSIGLLLVNVR